MSVFVDGIEYLTVREYCHLHSIPNGTVVTWLHSSRLPYVLIRGQIHIARDTLPTPSKYKRKKATVWKTQDGKLERIEQKMSHKKEHK